MLDPLLMSLQPSLTTVDVKWRIGTNLGQFSYVQCGSLQSDVFVVN